MDIIKDSRVNEDTSSIHVDIFWFCLALWVPTSKHFFLLLNLIYSFDSNAIFTKLDGHVQMCK